MELTDIASSKKQKKLSKNEQKQMSATRQVQIGACVCFRAKRTNLA
jgi:hypothetical protein